MISCKELRQKLTEQPMFGDKTWMLSPLAWGISEEAKLELEEIGHACLAYHHGLENLYIRATSGKNLLRNRELYAPWVAEYLERGKPASLIEHGKASFNKGKVPSVLRPDLLITDEGYAMSELDSVPGGIGLTAFLNRIYSEDTQDNGDIIGEKDLMVDAFYESLAALIPKKENPRIVLLVSEESRDYRLEMEWLSLQLREKGKELYCLSPEAVIQDEEGLLFVSDGRQMRIDLVYRFFELFDLPNIPTARIILDAVNKGQLVVTPPMRTFQEEKMGFALFHHHRLQDYWKEALDKRSLRILQRLIPQTWIIDPAPLPPGAFLDGPSIGGQPITDWRQLEQASQKERDLIIKLSGFNEKAWGARSVTLGSDSSKEEWTAAIEEALGNAENSLYIVQVYKKPKRLKHPVYEKDCGESMERDGRVRFCPYYFVKKGTVQLVGALTTFCPPDKKIIHGMSDAVLLPTRVVRTS